MSKFKQSGMSTYLLVFLLISLAFFLMCAFRLMPAYSENYYVVAALKSLAESHQDDLKDLNKGKIRQELSQFYMLNNVRSDAAKALEVVKEKESTKIIVQYEVRVPIMFNIDAIMSFNNVLDSSKPGECCKVEEAQEN